MKQILKRVATASLLVCAGLAAMAQPVPPGPGGGPGSGPGWMMQNHPADGARMRQHMDERIASHMADLKTILRITPTQEAAWASFTASMKPAAGAPAWRSPQERDKLRAEMDKLSTPERMDRMRALQAERYAKRSAEMDRRNAAVKAFYAVLAPEQQKVFDVEHKRLQHGAWGRMHGGGPGGMHGDGPGMMHGGGPGMMR